ncbi:MAG: RDD family protein [Planctomycetota bacterium]|jgi:hypothetical protein|nr:RDD family protein [Planctomycetota bacterium]
MSINSNWYYAQNYKQQGPEDLEHIKYLIKSRQLDEDTLVWHQSLSEWTAANRLGIFNPGAQKPNKETTTNIIEPDVEFVEQNADTRDSNAFLTSPWNSLRRFIARSIDSSIIIFILGVFFKFNIASFPSLIVCFIVTIFAHAYCQSRWGTTPGKTVMGYQIRANNGNKMSFQQAIERETQIAWSGLGFGIPLYSLYTLLRSYLLLRSSGHTSWDKKCNTVVSYK